MFALPKGDHCQLGENSATPLYRVYVEFPSYVAQTQLYVVSWQQTISRMEPHLVLYFQISIT